MKIHEYQVKTLLREFCVPVPKGDRVVRDGIIPMKQRMADNRDPVVWLPR